jgi:hypothetical protein
VEESGHGVINYTMTTILCQHLPGGAEESHVNSEDNRSVC